MLLQYADFFFLLGWSLHAKQERKKNQLDPILITQLGTELQNLISLFRFPCLLNSNIKFRNNQFPNRQDWVGGVIKMCQSGQAAPPTPITTTTPLPLSPNSKAVISMEDMVGCFNEVFLSAGKRVEANTRWRDWCAGALRAPAASVHHIIGIQCLARSPPASKSSMRSAMINGLYL